MLVRLRGGEDGENLDGASLPRHSLPTNRAQFVPAVFGDRLDDGHREDEQLLREPSYVSTVPLMYCGTQVTQLTKEGLVRAFAYSL